MPVFQRVLKCFESQAELGRQVGVDRFVVRYWMRLGFIPADRALGVAMAASAHGGKVTVTELLREAEIGRAQVNAHGGARKVRLVGGAVGERVPPHEMGAPE